MATNFLRQSTSVTIELGPFNDATDGVTAETGLSAAMDHATTGIRLIKNGAADVDRNDSTAPAHSVYGCYDIVLDATDTNTVGNLRVIYADSTTCTPAWRDFQVVEESVYDASFTANAMPDVIQSGTATGGSTTTLVDTALTEAEDFWNGKALRILDVSTGITHDVYVTDFVASTDTITFTPTLAAAIVSGDFYELRQAPVVDVHRYIGATAAALIQVTDITSDGSAINTVSGVVESNLMQVHGDALGGTKPHDTP